MNQPVYKPTGSCGRAVFDWPGNTASLSVIGVLSGRASSKLLTIVRCDFRNAEKRIRRRLRRSKRVPVYSREARFKGPRHGSL